MGIMDIIKSVNTLKEIDRLIQNYKSELILIEKTITNSKGNPLELYCLNSMCELVERIIGDLERLRLKVGE